MRCCTFKTGAPHGFDTVQAFDRIWPAVCDHASETWQAPALAGTLNGAPLVDQTLPLHVIDAEPLGQPEPLRLADADAPRPDGFPVPPAPQESCAWTSKAHALPFRSEKNEEVGATHAVVGQTPHGTGAALALPAVAAYPRTSTSPVPVLS